MEKVCEIIGKLRTKPVVQDKKQDTKKGKKDDKKGKKDKKDKKDKSSKSSKKSKKSTKEVKMFSNEFTVDELYSIENFFETHEGKLYWTLAQQNSHVHLKVNHPSTI